MGDENHIRTLRDYSKPSHEGYMNTIELPVGNNMVPLRSDTIRLVQNICSFHKLRSEDPNQHLKDFLKLVDLLDLDGENRERTRLRLFQFSLLDQVSNWLERLLAGSITTWEDLTTCFLAQFFPPERTAKLRNNILMFQQHHRESLSEAWTRLKDLLQKVPHHGIDLWLQDLAFYDNKSWNDPWDFTKPVKAITLPQDVLMNKITTSCEICSGPHDTQYCMEDPEQAFVEYTSLRTDEEGLVSNFMASQDARFSKFEADFKQQQSEMTNKIDTVLKAITDRIAGALPSDTVKNPKLSTYPVLSARSYPTEDPQCSTHIHGSINAITIHPKQQSESHDDKPEENKEEEKDNQENIHVNPSVPPDLLISFITEKVLKLNSFFESLGLVPQSSNTKLVCTKGDDSDVMFIEIVKTNDDSHKEEPKVGEQEVEYFDIFPTRSELAYHKYLMCGNFTYNIDFMIVEDISSIIDLRLSQVVLGRPFVEISNMNHDPPEGVVRFTNKTNEVAYKMPHKIKQYNSLSDLEKQHTKLFYLRNDEDRRRGVEKFLIKNEDEIFTDARDGYPDGVASPAM
ncbi:MAK10-like protein [Tanacetum coccineum]